MSNPPSLLSPQHYTRTHAHTHTHTHIELRPLDPRRRIINHLPPVCPEHNRRLNNRHKYQCNRNTAPQPIQLPLEHERRDDRYGDGQEVVRNDANIAANMLSSLSTQDPAAHGRNCVKALKQRRDRHHAHHVCNDLGILCEQEDKPAPRGDHEQEVDHAEEDGCDKAGVGSGFGAIFEGSTEKVGDARGGGDWEGKWELESNACCGDEDRLGGEVGGVKVGREEGEQLEGDELSFDDDETRER